MLPIRYGRILAMVLGSGDTIGVIQGSCPEWGDIMIITLTECDALMCNPKGTVTWADIANELISMGCVMRQISFKDENVIEYQFDDSEGEFKRIELTQEDFILLNHATIVRADLWNW